MGGISLDVAQTTETGFQYDRYWMVVDGEGRFVSQREAPLLALFQPGLTGEGIVVHYKGESVLLPFNREYGAMDIISTTVHKDQLHSQVENQEINEWFSDHLHKHVRVVRQAPNVHRTVKNHPEAKTNYSDGNQYLLIGKASLRLLNEKLDEKIAMNRFRPNIVFDGGQPHKEDIWQQLQIGPATFQVTKKCTRCKIITIDQATGQVGKEPLKTLSTYRKEDKKIKFGVYLKNPGSNNKEIKPGDKITPFY